jgi:2-oxoglutarate dehydrogenase complex dehydrogenase (E1) component-like enzyme
VCSGKVAYAAMQRRDEAELPAAVVRVEQLYPFPGERLAEVVAGYPNAERIVWLQEEPVNMGAWTFVVSRQAPLALPLSLVSRPESGSPACGSLSVHNQEFEQLMIDLEKAVKS